jgi:hypothetical protein
MSPGGGNRKTLPVFYKTKDGQIFWEGRMTDPNHLREQARKCRVLAKTAIDDELIEQLRIWSVELADEADTVERYAAESEALSYRSRPNSARV